MSTQSLYDEDFYAWTQQQADLLRRLPSPVNELDLEHIDEGIVGAGGEDWFPSSRFTNL